VAHSSLESPHLGCPIHRSIIAMSGVCPAHLRIPSSLKRHHTFGHDHFVTFSSRRRLPFLGHGDLLQSLSSPKDVRRYR
jgi:hypothetical protein